MENPIKAIDVWTLIQEGKFEEACFRADQDFQKTGNLFLMRNKVYALMNLEKYEEVIEIIEDLIKQENGESQHDFIFLGIANWLLAKTEEAIKIWHQGINSKYTDAAGGVELQIILYFASTKMANAALKAECVNQIKKLLKSKKALNWPGPLGGYMLNAIGDVDLLKLASQIPILRERQQSQAYFSIGTKNLENKRISEFESSLTKSIGYGSLVYLEPVYYLAKGELIRRVD